MVSGGRILGITSKEMMKETNYKPFIEQIGGQIVCTSRPMRDCVGWGKEVQIIAKLNSKVVRIVWEGKK